MYVIESGGKFKCDSMILVSKVGDIIEETKRLAISYLSLTLQQGSMISSLAAIFATEPLTMLLRYTIGVFPISCISSKT